MPKPLKPSLRIRNAPPYRAAAQKNSRTGINGVSITFTHGNAGRRLMKVVNVYYKLKGKEHNKRFYLHLFPSQAACLESAVRFRRKMEREMRKERGLKRAASGLE